MVTHVILPIIKKLYPMLVAQQITGVQPIPYNNIWTIGHSKDYRVWSKKKYNFSRARWYQAEFNPKDYYEAHIWCEEQFGKHPKNPDAWSRWWHRFENSILFRDERDYILFTLRWS